MDAGDGETKCSSRHKAALIRSPHPPTAEPDYRKLGGGFKTGGGEKDGLAVQLVN